ncbi:MAG: hypothetical protein QOH72_1685 [Solirubrobacteraceae bacterium]|nr:hypothetical protein [Solirubrobacteraceae bacterium]
MRSTPLRRAAAASAVAAAALGATAGPAAGVISLAPVRPCLSELDAVSPNASGLTPGGAAKLDLASSGRPLLSTATQPAAADGTYRVPSPYPRSVTDTWFPDRATDTIPLQMTITDLTRLNSGQPATSPEVAASANVTFSRWNIFVGTPGGVAPVPRARIRFRAVGWTADVGKPLYVHYILGRRDIRSVRLGVLAGPCGNVTKTLDRAFPFRPVRPGRYRFLFNASATNPNKQPRIVTRLLRVRKKDAIPARPSAARL